MHNAIKKKIKKKKICTAQYVHTNQCINSITFVNTSSNLLNKGEGGRGMGPVKIVIKINLLNKFSICRRFHQPNLYEVT